MRLREGSPRWGGLHSSEVRREINCTLSPMVARLTIHTIGYDGINLMTLMKMGAYVIQDGKIAAFIFSTDVFHTSPRWKGSIQVII